MTPDDTDPLNWPAPGEPDGPEMVSLQRVALLMDGTRQQEDGTSTGTAA